MKECKRTVLQSTGVETSERRTFNEEPVGVDFSDGSSGEKGEGGQEVHHEHGRPAERAQTASPAPRDVTGLQSGARRVQLEPHRSNDGNRRDDGPKAKGTLTHPHFVQVNDLSGFATSVWSQTCNQAKVQEKLRH